MIPIPSPNKEPSFRDAVKKIVQEELKDYNERLRKIEGDIQSLRKDGKGGISVDVRRLDTLESTLKVAMSDMRQKFSDVISQQETKIADNNKSIRSLETRISESGRGKTSGGSPRDVDDVKMDLKTLEKNVFEQFDQIHKSISDLSSSLAAKTRDFDTAMSRLGRFQDEAKALNSDNFIRDVAALKMRLDRIEASMTDLRTREPVVIE